MAQTKKTNPEPQATTSVVSPADMMRHVLTQGKALHTQALTFCYAAAAWLLTVNHFRAAGTDGYLSQAKASEYLREQLEDQLGVTSRMVMNYVSPAEKIFAGLTSSQKLFGSTLHELGKAKTPEDMVTVIGRWLESVKDRKIQSLQDLRTSLGYETNETRKAKKATPAVIMQRAETAVENVVENYIEKAKDDKVRQQRTADFATAVVSEVKEKGTFLAAAIRALTDKAALEQIIAVAQNQIKELDRLAKQAAGATKATAKANGVKTVRSKKVKRAAVQQQTV